ncbi:MAG TPA: UbiD family decarboxylase domain-containing protein, partial [Thermoplasmata archaeon]|nr:UbiD family decarboxylase domain-containing protein [Thermoplasmata archaeon]
MAVREWLERFSDDVLRIEADTSREIEATRILVREPRRPVHFRSLDGAEAVGNLWSTRDRVAAALRTPNETLLGRLMEAQTHPMDTRLVDSAPFLRHSSTDVNLLDLPVPKLFPRDAGRYITAGVWVAEWKGVRNLSFHRILLLGKNRGACRIVPRHLRHMY